MQVKFCSFKGKVFSVEPPTFVELAVTHTEPGVKGNTATNVTKPATLETGATVTVPMFIKTGIVKSGYAYRRVYGKSIIII